MGIFSNLRGRFRHHEGPEAHAGGFCVERNCLLDCQACRPRRTETHSGFFLRLSLKGGDRLKNISESGHHRVGLNQVVSKDGLLIFVVLEVSQVDRDFYDVFFLKRSGQSVPKVLITELSSSIRQRRVENEAKSMKKIRFANLVFPNYDSVSSEVHVERAKVSEILNGDM